MGKTEDAIKAVVAVAIVAAPIPAPLLDDCQNVSATACPAQPPDQHHVHDGQPETYRPVRGMAADGGAPTYPRTTGITVTPV